MGSLMPNLLAARLEHTVSLHELFNGKVVRVEVCLRTKLHFFSVSLSCQLTVRQKGKAARAAGGMQRARLPCLLPSSQVHTMAGCLLTPVSARVAVL